MEISQDPIGSSLMEDAATGARERADDRFVGAILTNWMQLWTAPPSDARSLVGTGEHVLLDLTAEYAGAAAVGAEVGVVIALSAWDVPATVRIRAAAMDSMRLILRPDVTFMFFQFSFELPKVEGEPVESGGGSGVRRRS
ncbi:hypothetical protein [Streptomyces sp. PTD5-9]|uniref:hypothetical protein n=1 Tax=Streptomyces sp. PTD5-9 TaxID=3120150 RepID=UPI00300BB34D